MTAQELKAAQTEVNDLETQLATLRRQEREGIDTARSINAQVRLAQAKIRAGDEQLSSLRGRITQHLREEQERLAEERQKAEEERKAAEAKANAEAKE